MDEALTLDWIKTVWATHPGSLLHKKAMLVLDSFHCHWMPSIKSELRGMKMDLVIIPGGMTRLLQPLDVSVNKPIKDALRGKWNNWLSDSSHTFTPGGRMRQPTLVDVTQWILATWRLGSSCHPQQLSQVLHLKRTSRQRRRRGLAGSTECVYYDGALNDVNKATIQSLLDSDSDDENTFEGFR